MFMIFQEEKLVTAGILAFLFLSLFGRILLGFLYLKMIKEADNMATTNNRPLKQCKLKFANCYQMNNGVANIPVFVDKFLNKLKLGPFSFSTIYHCSGQSMLLSVIFSGIGICKGIAEGRTLGEILPFYIVSFVGLYLYFTVSTLVDIKGKRRILKVNLVDYLENHLSSRLDVTEGDMKMLYGEDAGGKGRNDRLADVGRRKRSDRRAVEQRQMGGRNPAEPGKPADYVSLSREYRTESDDRAESGYKAESDYRAAPDFKTESYPTAFSGELSQVRITDEELEALLKEFLPT